MTSFAVQPGRLFIAGSWREADSGKRFRVTDPADGSTLTDAADADPDDALDALDAAVDAQADWAATAPRERGEILRRAFELITAQADDFARLISLEMGKTLAEAKGEVTYGAEFFRWFAEEAVRIHGRWMQNPAGGSRLLTVKKPVGPCLFITPWNFPLAMGTRKIGPAVAAGCTMVVKPAEATPLTMLKLAETMAGGRPACRRPQRRHHQQLARGLLGADGRRPAAQAELHRVDVRRQDAGQAVRRPAPADQHGARRQRAVPGLRGRRRRRRRRRRDDREDAQHGRGVHGRQPLPGPRVDRRRVRGEARRPDGQARHRSRPGRRCRRRPAHRREGRRVGAPARDRRRPRRRDRRHRRHDPRGPGHASTPRPCCSGCPPTRRSTARRSSARSRPITTFASEEEAIERANATEYGLASYAYTNDLGRTIRLAEKLEYGMVGINTGLISNAAGAVRWGEVERLRPRGRLRGHRGVPRHHLRLAARRLTARRSSWSRTAT